jgi:hypothetical protein
VVEIVAIEIVDHLLQGAGADERVHRSTVEAQQCASCAPAPVR